MFQHCGMTASDDLGIAEPRYSLANVIDILAGVCDDKIAGVNLGEFLRLLCRNERLCFRRPCAVIGVNLTVMDATNT